MVELENIFLLRIMVQLDYFYLLIFMVELENIFLLRIMVQLEYFYLFIFAL